MAEHEGRLTLWAIEVFLAAEDAGAITAAARRLGVSASGASQQIASLEEALGAALFDRSARPLTLTPAGKIFRRHARAIVNEVSAARGALGLAELAGLTGIRLGMIEDFEAEVTPRLLTAMGAEFAGCRFLLETGASHRLHDLLDARALDMIVAADMGAAESWMELHPLLEEPFVAAVPRGRIEPGDGLDRFRALPLILYTARHHMGRQIRDHLAHQNLRLSHRFELDSYHAIMAMVA
ncbi:MAG: LysR family transcriptional regulator, partial [Alphaproteobacteria bacterium HGW-Alphaproteobacteria-6]